MSDCHIVLGCCIRAVSSVGGQEGIGPDLVLASCWPWVQLVVASLLKHLLCFNSVWTAHLRTLYHFKDMRLERWNVNINGRFHC